MLLATPKPADAGQEMYWRRTFPGVPEEARAARDFLRALLPGHPRLDDVLLAADELVVNTLQHTRSGAKGGTFHLEVLLDEEGVTVSVTDQGGPKEPAAHTDDRDLSESGRGLALVTALATRWTWSGGIQGRTITACFPAA
jgi:anti-sigma regulatory factor (Ser/Thr protein kinase)